MQPGPRGDRSTCRATDPRTCSIWPASEPNTRRSSDKGKTKRRPRSRPSKSSEADLAMEALRKAIAAGFRNVEWLRTDADLNALRGREDFKALEADLAARVAATSPDKLKASQQALALRQKLAQADPQQQATPRRPGRQPARHRPGPARSRQARRSTKASPTGHCFPRGTGQGRAEERAISDGPGGEPLRSGRLLLEVWAAG